MVVRKMVVVIVALAVILVAVGAAYVLTAPSTTPPPGTAPTVTLTSPANSATGVALNAKVTATFSKAMDSATISASTFTLKQGTTSVSGAVTYSGLIATLTPSSNLAASTAYAATVTTGAKDTTGLALAANFAWSFTTGVAPDTTAPLVISTSAITAVSLNSNITATFSEAMDSTTITTSTFTVKQGTTVVAGAVSYTGVIATFNPTADFAATTTYTATITTGAKDVAGNALAANFVWTFATGAAPDTTPPVVSSVSPLAAAVAVNVSANITATFSEAMDAATITSSTFTLKQGSTSVGGAVSFAGLIATFNPASDLAANTTYNATITTGAKDLAGNALTANFVWNFTTAAGAPVDTTPPVVSSHSPVLAVAVGSNVTATFSEAMDPTTITSSTFTVNQNMTPVSGAVTYAGLTATFDPVADFSNNTTYTATITTGAKDLAGNALAAAYVWNFTSAPGSACGLLTVDLGSAASFAVLAGSTVTNTGLTNVSGDLGVSPGTAVTGFGPGVVTNGSIHAGDTVAADAIANVSTAYTDAAGRTLCAISVAGNLGGMTLAPGLYKSTSSLAISSGDLTLDAQGDANAVWIFQMATTFDVSDGLHVVLAGGAKASNIFWQVGTSATIGLGAVVYGTILADQSITLNTGAVLEGRALAHIAAVALDTCTVTKPSP